MKSPLDLHQPAKSEGTCRTAVVVSGPWRSFANVDVRGLFRTHLLQALAGQSSTGDSTDSGTVCEVDVYFDVDLAEPLPMPEFQGFGAHERKDVEIIIREEFADVTILDQDRAGAASPPRGRSRIATAFSPPAPGKCDLSREGRLPQLQYAYYILEPMKRSLDLVTEVEAVHGFRYDWLVRSRFDLGFVLPMAPITQYSPTAIHLPSIGYPVADFFAILPRHLTGAYFNAVDRCDDCRLTRADLPELYGPIETVLYQHMELHQAPIRYQEFGISVVGPSKNTTCQALPAFHIPCQLLVAAKFVRWSQEECRAILHMSVLAECHWTMDGDFADSGHPLMQATTKLQAEHRMIEILREYGTDIANRTSESELPAFHNISLGYQNPYPKKDGASGHEFKINYVVHQDRKHTVELRDAMVCAIMRHLAFFAEPNAFENTTDFLDGVPEDIRKDCDPLSFHASLSDDEDDIGGSLDQEFSGKLLAQRLQSAIRGLTDGTTPVTRETLPFSAVDV